MAAETRINARETPCPDPSVHERHSRLSEQASSAALIATHPERNSDAKDSKDSVLDEQGKLSSKSAALSLKYARAQDLPSFPSRGHDANSAGAAAMLAKDYRMKDLWQPEASLAGSKAALKAHREGGKLDLWRPTGSATGNSAATMAMRNKALSPQIDRGYTETGKNNSLLAATKSHNLGRQRADSTPVRPAPNYPDSHNSAHNALNAANVSHRTSPKSAPDGWESEANQAARIKNIGTHMSRDMFGEHPPVEPEVDEQKHQAALRASAVSMAKQMYEYQNRTALSSDAMETAGAETAHRRSQSSTSQGNIKQEAMRYIRLQDTAHKLAQERLAKVDKELEPGRYREYYGYPGSSPKKSRLSIRGGRRKRASSEGTAAFDDSDDEEQARKIRHQMSQLSTGVNTVNDKQREADRAKLLAAAEKRVQARMHDMDEKVFQETGKVSQAMMDDWETKARQKAEKDREERERHPGKTHIGGGKFMDQSAIEAIAAARLRPTLDEINDAAEKRRARDEEIQREKDQAHTEKMEEKARQQAQKAEFRRIKDADKAAAKKEREDRKAAERAEKEETKARKSAEVRKSREVKPDEATMVAGGAALGEAADPTHDDNHDDVHEEPKEKAGARGMFGKLRNTLKRRSDDKHGEERGRFILPPETPAGDLEHAGAAEHDTLHKGEEDAPEPSHEAVGLGAAGVGVAGAAAVEDLKHEDAREEPDVFDEDDVQAEEPPPAHETEPAAEDAFHHAGAFAPLELDRRPDAAAQPAGRSVDDDESEELYDSDEDEGEAQVPGAAPVEKKHDVDDDFMTPATTPAAVAAAELPGSRSDDMSRGIEPEPEESSAAAAREPAELDPVKPSAPAAAGEPAGEEPGYITLANSGAPQGAPAMTVDDKTQSSAPPISPAPAPTVKTGPRSAETADVQSPRERKGGLRGLLSKLRHRDSDPEEPKSPSASGKSERSFQGGAKYTGVGEKSDDFITPVTTTSAGKEAEGEHVGTDGPIGDPNQVSGLGGDPAPASPTSAQREDIVSPGHADEEHEGKERKRGRLVKKKLGLGKHSNKSRERETLGGAHEEGRGSGVSNGNEEDQFEEARDHFDETLAPPPAFTGQKSESPHRGTRFQEEL